MKQTETTQATFEEPTYSEEVEKQILTLIQLANEAGTPINFVQLMNHRSIRELGTRSDRQAVLAIRELQKAGSEVIVFDSAANNFSLKESVAAPEPEPTTWIPTQSPTN